jgi:hypothetical protein
MSTSQLRGYSPSLAASLSAQIRAVPGGVTDDGNAPGAGVGAAWLGWQVTDRSEHDIHA